MSDGGGDFGGDFGGGDHHGSHHDASHSHDGHHHGNTFVYTGEDYSYYGADDDSKKRANNQLKSNNCIKKPTILEAVEANFSKEVSAASKVARGVAWLGSLVIIAGGTKELFAPKIDENGNKKLFPAFAKIGVGLAIAYGTLVHGGAAKIAAFARK